MVISHKYKHLFIEVPSTASTAISAELREHYGGELILGNTPTTPSFDACFEAESCLVEGSTSPSQRCETRWTKPSVITHA